MITVLLTDTEWMQLIDAEREDSALPRCCANISALRDVVIYVARNGGVCDAFTKPELERLYGWCFPAHDVPADGALAKFAAQLELTAEVAHSPQPEGGCP